MSENYWNRLHTRCPLLRGKWVVHPKPPGVKERLAPNRNFLSDTVRIKSLEIGNATEKVGTIVASLIYTFQRHHVAPERRHKILSKDCQASSITPVWLSGVIWCYLLPHLLGLRWPTAPLLTSAPLPSRNTTHSSSLIPIPPIPPSLCLANAHTLWRLKIECHFVREECFPWPFRLAVMYAKRLAWHSSQLSSIISLFYVCCLRTGLAWDLYPSMGLCC